MGLIIRVVLTLSLIKFKAFAHEVYVEGQDAYVTENQMTAFDFFSALRYKNMYVLFTMQNCVHCDEVKPDWYKVETGPDTEKIEINCQDQNLISVCSFFGIQKMPTIILIKEGSYYFMPSGINSNSRTQDKIQNFLDYDYLNAYIQDILRFENETGYRKQIGQVMTQGKRIFQQILEENANGLATLGFTAPNKYILTLLSLIFMVFPFIMVVYTLRNFCDNENQKAQKDLVTKLEEIERQKKQQQQQLKKNK